MSGSEMLVGVEFILATSEVGSTRKEGSAAFLMTKVTTAPDLRCDGRVRQRS